MKYVGLMLGGGAVSQGVCELASGDASDAVEFAKMFMRKE
jgi:hypothetical protein